MRYIPTVLLMSFLFSCQSPGSVKTGTKKNQTSLNVIAYYSGNANEIDSFEVEKLSHIIFSFCHLKGNRLSVDNARDTATIHKLVSLKKRNPSLKVQLSLGGWGGCEPCSPIFVVDSARKIFAASVKELCDHFKTDGIDLDWEYPGIEGHPGHPFLKEDKANFTALVKELRNVLGQEKEISFAAGGFKEFFDGSIDWKEVMPLVDRVNLMSYDLVGGYNTMTGHHTALFSNAKQERSADHGIRYLDSLGVPLNKIVIGAAFYARTWENVPDADNGLYKPGKFKSFIAFNQFDKWLSSDSGFVFYLDTVAAAPYVYNASRKLFATFDDPVSIQKKTAYALDKGLNGIMFWELPLDKKTAGLLYQIDSTISARRK